MIDIIINRIVPHSVQLLLLIISSSISSSEVTLVHHLDIVLKRTKTPTNMSDLK